MLALDRFYLLSLQTLEHIQFAVHFDFFTFELGDAVFNILYLAILESLGQVLLLVFNGFLQVFQFRLFFAHLGLDLTSRLVLYHELVAASFAEEGQLFLCNLYLLLEELVFA